MIGEPPGGVDLVLAERVVRVETLFLRAATGEVLDGERHRRAGGHRSALQRGDQRREDARGEVGVLRERLVHEYQRGSVATSAM